MKAAILLVLCAGAMLTAIGCSGNPPATAEEEKGFKNPSGTPPPGFKAPPSTNIPKPATGG